MPKKPNCKDEAKRLLIRYLKSIYIKKKDGSPLSADEIAVITVKKNLGEIVYDISGGTIVDSSDYPKGIPAGKMGISRATINNAIDELIQSGQVRKQYGVYEYVPSEDELKKAYPILNIASDIKISPLQVDRCAFYKVQGQYAPWITEYINAHFSHDDIYAVSIGDLIMCLDIHIPSSSKSVTKRYSVEERVGDVLQPFAIRYPKYFDEADGLSEEELVLSTQEEIESAEYGRITKDPPRRNIKKKAGTATEDN